MLFLCGNFISLRFLSFLSLVFKESIWFKEGQTSDQLRNLKLVAPAFEMQLLMTFQGLWRTPDTSKWLTAFSQ